MYLTGFTPDIPCIILEASRGTREKCVLETFGHKSLSFIKAPTDQEHRLKQLSRSTLKGPPLTTPLPPSLVTPSPPTLSSAQSSPLSQPLTQVGGDEGQQSTNTSIDTGLVRRSAALAPRNETNKLAVCVDNGTAAVTLARVLAACGQTGAEHVVGDLSDAVVLAAGCARDDGDIDLAQRRGRGAAGAGGAPARDGGDGSRGRVGAGGRQRGVADGGAGGDGGGELPDGDVVVEGRAGEAGVDLDRGDADEDSAGVAVLWVVSWRFCFAGERGCRCLTKLPARTVRVEAVWPSVQWAAVTTVRESRREPPQKWEPLRCRLTMKGKSPATAAVPPTMATESWGVGAAETAEAMRPAMSALYCILTKSLGVRGVSVGRGSASG